MVDLKNFQQFSIDKNTWQATIGGGTLLRDVTKKLHENGNRAMAHGTCPQVGIGGHATIGGLGPTSRMWGSALDHVQEVEVVLANSSIVRASEKQNSDVFFALKGAGARYAASPTTTYPPLTSFLALASSLNSRSALKLNQENPSSIPTASKQDPPPPKPQRSKNGKP